MRNMFKLKPRLNEYNFWLHLKCIYSDLIWKIDQIYDDQSFKIIQYLVNKGYMECPNCNKIVRWIDDFGCCVVCGNWDS